MSVAGRADIYVRPSSPESPPGVRGEAPRRHVSMSESNRQVSRGDAAGYQERLVPGDPHWRGNIAGHMQRYRFASQFVAGKRVLDAGCGVGYGSRMLLQAGASEVIGVDLSEEALKVARRQFSGPGVRFVCDDCESLCGIDGGFDVIVALESLEHFQQPDRFLRRATELLQRGGVLVCSTPNSLFTGSAANSPPNNPFHVREYALDEFQPLLQEHFLDVRIAGQRLTAACLFGLRSLQLRSNPFIRVALWLESIWRRRPDPLADIVFTEGDFVVTDANPEEAGQFVAVCRSPRRR